MTNKVAAFFRRHYAPKPSLVTEPPYNSVAKKCLRLLYYAFCMAVGIIALWGLKVLLTLILAKILLATYASHPAWVGPLSETIMGLLTWGKLAGTLLGILFLGPLLFDKSAWLFKLMPPKESYNILDFFRDLKSTTITLSQKIKGIFVKKPTQEQNKALPLPNSPTYPPSLLTSSLPLNQTPNNPTQNSWMNRKNTTTKRIGAPP